MNTKKFHFFILLLSFFILPFSVPAEYPASPSSTLIASGQMGSGSHSKQKSRGGKHSGKRSSSKSHSGRHSSSKGSRHQKPHRGKGNHKGSMHKQKPNTVRGKQHKPQGSASSQKGSASSQNLKSSQASKKPQTSKSNIHVNKPDKSAGKAREGVFYENMDGTPMNGTTTSTPAETPPEKKEKKHKKHKPSDDNSGLPKNPIDLFFPGDNKEHKHHKHRKHHDGDKDVRDFFGVDDPFKSQCDRYQARYAEALAKMHHWERLVKEEQNKASLLEAQLAQILVNRPSGQDAPSPEEVKISSQLRTANDLLTIDRSILKAQQEMVQDYKNLLKDCK